jgi:acyl carrier protein
MENLENQIREIMSLIFNIDVGEIPNDAAYGIFEPWDSLNHMNLITALEEEFSIRFADEDVTDMLNISLVEEILKSNIN